MPEVIKHGAPVVLDCDFSLEDTDQDLVVKWFFNRNNRTLVYQWIPGEFILHRLVIFFIQSFFLCTNIKWDFNEQLSNL